MQKSIFFASGGDDAAARTCANKVDLHGRCVIPGLVDSHCHILGGLQRAAMRMIELDAETKPADLAAVILRHAEPDDAAPFDELLLSLFMERLLSRGGCFLEKLFIKNYKKEPALVVNWRFFCVYYV